MQSVFMRIANRFELSGSEMFARSPVAFGEPTARGETEVPTISPLPNRYELRICQAKSKS
jgi:hypothetical protein